MHKEYKHIIDNGQKAILFIHGIVGTPNHFRRFLPLVPQGVSVWNLLLDGHGKGVRDFSKTSMKKWEAQVQAAVDELSATHREIYIVGHSMGTLLAVEQACKNDKIRGLFLLAVPLRVAVKPRAVRAGVQVCFEKVREDDSFAMATKESCGVQPDKNLFHYIGWIPRYLELFRKMRQTRKALHQLTTPTLAFQSGKDCMVSARSVKLLQRNPAIKVTVLPESDHNYYAPQELAMLLEHFEQWREML